VDERGVPPTHERSNFAGAKEALLDPAHVPGPNVHRMRGEASDLAIAASEYETELRETIADKVGGLPVIDLVVLGIGDDGHTASLFPGESTVNVTDKLVCAVPGAGAREARLTLTTPMLENARASVVIVLGAGKHAALERVWAVNGDLATTPSRIIRNFRGSITWVIDRAAGGMG
jgi:6-phosphogluconolactonase